MNTTEPKTILDQFTVVERAIIYARVSTDEQAESGTSIDNQVDKSLAYAAALNMNVVAILKEDYSGKPLDRPELNKVRDMLRAGQADNLIVYKTNRLDRSEWGVNLLILLQELKSLGVSLHYSQDRRRIDLTNPVEALMQSISGWQAGEDHRETVSKLHEGRIRRASDGYVVPHGASPYGYKPVKRDKRWYFEIVEAEAVIVRLIFQLYIFGDESGKPLNMILIAERLNQMGIVTRNGKKWVRSAVGAILENETYSGTWHYRKEAARKNSSIQPIPVKVKPIVEREEWEAAQERLKYNKEYSRRNRKPGRYLLATRLTCGVCGYKMFGCAKDNKYFYYVCRNVGLSKEKVCECHNPRYIVGVVDTKVWDRLEAVSRDQKQLIDGLRDYQALQESKVEPINRELAYVEELTKEKNAEWEDEYLNQKLLTSERAKAKKAVEIANLEKVLDGLEKRKAELLDQLKEKTLTDEEIMGLTTFALQVANDMATLREAEAKGLDLPELKAAVYEAKRRLLAMLDVQVTLFVKNGKRKARITAKYCPNGDKALSVEVDNICTLGHNELNHRAGNRRTWITFVDEIDLE